MPTIISGDTGIDKVQNGAVDLATDVTGSLPSGNGGIPSQSGNGGKFLTTDGTSTSWGTVSGGVTSLNGQTGAITNTDLYAIGSYVTGRPQNTTSYAVDSTIAGSSLYAVCPPSYWNGSAWRIAGTTIAPSANLVNVGTWRCVSNAYGASGTGASGLWVRIS